MQMETGRRVLYIAKNIFIIFTEIPLFNISTTFHTLLSFKIKVSSWIPSRFQPCLLWNTTHIQRSPQTQTGEDWVSTRRACVLPWLRSAREHSLITAILTVTATTSLLGYTLPPSGFLNTMAELCLSLNFMLMKSTVHILLYLESFL